MLTGRARTTATWAAAAALAVLGVSLLLWHPGGSTAAPSHLDQQVTGTAPSRSHLPSARPSPSGAQSSAAEPSAVEPPTLPEGAQGLTVPAAAGFARFYFVRAINYAKVTGDTSAIRSSSDLSCAPCTKNVAAYIRGNQRNGLLTGAHLWRDAAVVRVELTGARTAVVDMKLTVGPFSYRASRTAKPETFPRHTIALRMWLAARGTNWVMYDWERLVL